MSIYEEFGIVMQIDKVDLYELMFTGVVFFVLQCIPCDIFMQFIRNLMEIGAWWRMNWTTVDP